MFNVSGERGQGRVKGSTTVPLPQRSPKNCSCHYRPAECVLGRWVVVVVVAAADGGGSRDIEERRCGRSWWCGGGLKVEESDRRCLVDFCGPSPPFTAP